MSQDRDWIDVDLTRWGTAETVHRDKELFSILRKAITGLRRIHFEYYSAKGEMTVRTVEPAKLIYRCRAWYLAGYCTHETRTACVSAFPHEKDWTDRRTL